VDDRELGQPADGDAVNGGESGEAPAPPPKFQLGVPPPDEYRCHGTTLRGERCGQWAVKASGVCRFHAARSLRDLTTPQFANSKAIPYLPKRLHSMFLASMRDPSLDNLKKQIGLLDMREKELLKRLGTTESDKAWTQAREYLLRLMEATRAGDKNASFYAVEGLKKAILDGSNEVQQWDEIRENMEQRRKMVETERKREEYLRASITPEILAAMVGRIVMIVKSEVEDLRVRSNIADGIRAAVFGDRFMIDAEVIDESLALGEGAEEPLAAVAEG